MKRIIWRITYLFNKKQRDQEQREWEEIQRAAQARLDAWRDTWQEDACGLH